MGSIAGWQVWQRWLAAMFLLGALWGLAIWYLRKVWFFRDPVRTAPRIPGAILSAADGIVIYVRPYQGRSLLSEKLGRPIDVGEITGSDLPIAERGWLVGVYMSPLDVHFNYAPTDAVIENIVHTPAAVNLPMVDLWEYIKLTYLRRAVDLFAAKYRLVNERNTIFFRTSMPGTEREFRYAAVEIADKFVNKIDCFVKPGETVRAGQKLSFISRGSQVDLVLPRKGVTVEVKPGQRVTGGISVIARVGDGGKTIDN